MSTERRAGPVRTCVGCRARAPVAELLRVVAIEHRLMPDPARRLPGRGANLHPDPACLALAVRRRAFGRALRCSGVLDTAALGEYVGARHPGTGNIPGGANPAPPRITAR